MRIHLIYGLFCGGRGTQEFGLYQVQSLQMSFTKAIWGTKVKVFGTGPQEESSAKKVHFQPKTETFANKTLYWTTQRQVKRQNDIVELML